MYRFNIILTELCNANCSHCYMNLNSKKNKNTMSFDEIDIIIDKIPYNTSSVTLTGGEIFLVKDLLFHTIKKIKKLKLNWSQMVFIFIKVIIHTIY